MTGFSHAEHAHFPAGIDGIFNQPNRASLVFAQTPQAQKKAKTFTARTVTKARPAPSPPPLRKENTEGVLARAARGGNPLPMLNPKAPAVYGRAGANVFPVSG